MAKIYVSLIVEAQEEPMSGDYSGDIPTPLFISEYLLSAADNLIPGVSVERVVATDVTELYAR